MKKTDYKTKVINEISFVKDDDTLQKLYSSVHSFLRNFDENLKDEKPSFEEWSKQFEDEFSSDEDIEEYGMTLREFRMSIYKAEISDEFLTTEEFREKIQRW